MNKIAAFFEIGNSKSILLFFLLSCLLFPLSGQDEPSPKEIMQKSQESRIFKTMEAVSVFKTINKDGREKVSKIMILSKLSDDGLLEKRRINIIEPMDMKDTHILILDHKTEADEMWVYMPSLKEPRKIVSNKLSKSFMGSEFSLGDMSIPGENDFSFSLINSEVVDGDDCWVIECIPVDNKTTSGNKYAKEILYIGKNDFHTRKGEFFDKKGKLLKVMTVSNIEKVDPKTNAYVARYMAIENVQTKRKSEIIIEDVKVNLPIDDALFTIESLQENKKE